MTNGYLYGVLLYTGTTSTILPLSIPNPLLEVNTQYTDYTATVLDLETSAAITNTGSLSLSDLTITTGSLITNVRAQLEASGSTVSYTITGTALGTFIYQVGTGPQTLVFTQRTVTSSNSVVCSDAVLTYTLIGAPAFASIDSNTRTLTFDTSDSNMITSYTFNVRANLSTGTTQDFPLTLQVASQCQYTNLAAQTISDRSYTINDPELLFQFPAFTTNATTACTVNYILLDSAGNPPSASVYTITSSNRTIRIQTSDTALIGDRYLKVQGTITGFTATATSALFKVTFIAMSCATSYVVTPPSDYTAT